MDRTIIVSFIRSEIEKTKQKLQELALEKVEAEAGTSWSSRLHLDVEERIETAQGYLIRCRDILTTLERQKPDGSTVTVGSIVTLAIGGKSQIFILAEDGGGSIGDYFILSVRSPIGRTINGMHVGEEVTAKVPDGLITVQVEEIS